MKNQKKYNTVRTVPKIQMENHVNRYKIHTPNTHKDNCSISWLGVDTSKASGSVRLVYGTKHPLLVKNILFHIQLPSKHFLFYCI